MIILGLNGGEKREEQPDVAGAFRHDAAAALLVDGQLIAAVEEERLNRIKHTNCFPAHAIKHCLDAVRARLSEIDRIAINSDAWNIEREEMHECVVDPRRPLVDSAEAVVGRLFERDFKCDVSGKIRFCQHHFAHAWSAYALSGFSEGLVLSTDAWGDDCCGMVFRADGKKMTPLRRYHHSLGLYYLNMIQPLGFGRFDEYKAMGLAPYGNRDALSHMFKPIYRLLPRGEYEISQAECEAMLRTRDLYKHLRRQGQEFTKLHMDFAAGLQNSLEEIVFHILRHFVAETRLRNLCLAGGVAQNCTLNGKILESGLFENVFVQPAAYDAGGAIGSAYSVAFQEDPATRLTRMSHAFLGPHVGSEDEIAKGLKPWSELVAFEQLGNVTETAAKLLADGCVIGWIQDRSEFGPRALGNRSILADPRPAENKDRINAMVKKRESFRPFAPSVLAERAAEFFELPTTHASLSFMTYSLRVKKEMRARLAAVTHVDGTARVQTVEKATNNKFWHLLHAFGEITGVPVLLNTSFNNNSEPIVNSLDDGVCCFLTAELDYLIVGDYLVRRKGAIKGNLAVENCSVSIPNYCRLERSSKYWQETGRVSTSFALRHVKQIANSSSDQSGLQVRELSTDAFYLLLSSDGSHAIRELLDLSSQSHPGCRRRLVDELLQLWTERLVQITPCKGGNAVVRSSE